MADLLITTLKNPLNSAERVGEVKAIVLHSTAGASAESSIEWLRKIKLSYHYIIERDGLIYKCVPTSRIAFHAGKSRSYLGENLNRYSIGVAFANREDLNEPLTDEQREACALLVKQLKKAIPSIVCLTTHFAVSRGRKTDPKMIGYRWVGNIALDADIVCWGVLASDCKGKDFPRDPKEKT